MKPDIHVSRNLRIYDETLDIYYDTQCKTIGMPNATKNYIQFNLDTKPCETRGKNEGWLVIKTQEQFDELFSLLMSHSAFETVEEFNAKLRDSSTSTKTGEEKDV